MSSCGGAGWEEGGGEVEKDWINSFSVISICEKQPSIDHLNPFILLLLFPDLCDLCWPFCLKPSKIFFAFFVSFRSIFFQFIMQFKFRSEHQLENVTFLTFFCLFSYPRVDSRSLVEKHRWSFGPIRWGPGRQFGSMAGELLLCSLSTLRAVHKGRDIC